MKPYNIYPDGCFYGWDHVVALDDGTEYQSERAYKNLSRLMTCDVIEMELMLYKEQYVSARDAGVML